MINYTIDPHNNAVVNTEPKLTIMGYVNVPGVGTVDATFDFSNMPEAYHDLTASFINKRITVSLPKPTSPNEKGWLGRMFEKVFGSWN